MNLKAQRNIPAKNPVTPQTNAPADRELIIGTEVEKEHTQDFTLASKIACDHLAEDPHYYSKLMAAGLVDEPSAQELVAQSGNTAPHVPTQALIPVPKVALNSMPVNQTTGAPLPHFIDAERKTRPLSGDNLEHFGAQIDKVMSVALPRILTVSDMQSEGGAKITEPNAGITSDQEGKRWSINAYPENKKSTPPMM